MSNTTSRYYFHVSKEWSSLNARKTLNLTLQDLSPTEKTYFVAFSHNRFSMTNGSGKTIANGTLMETPSYFAPFASQRANVLQTYEVEDSYTGGNFTIYNDGTAELVDYGSGLPVTHIIYGKLYPHTS